MRRRHSPTLKFMLASPLWKRARSDWSFNTMCRMVLACVLCITSLVIWPKVTKLPQFKTKLHQKCHLVNGCISNCVACPLHSCYRCLQHRQSLSSLKLYNLMIITVVNAPQSAHKQTYTYVHLAVRWNVRFHLWPHCCIYNESPSRIFILTLSFVDVSQLRVIMPHTPFMCTALFQLFNPLVWWVTYRTMVW